MEKPEITVGPATDDEAYLRTDHTVWFDEVGSASSAAQLLSVPEHLRFAATTPTPTRGRTPVSTACGR